MSTTDPAELKREAITLLIMISYAVALGADSQRDHYVRRYLKRFGSRIPPSADLKRDGAAIAAIKAASRER